MESSLYTDQSGRFAFGSEQKAITALPDFRRELNKPALLEYFTFQNIFTDQTLLQDIRILPAGHFLTLRVQQDATPCLKSYWDYHFREPTKQLNREEYIEELDRLFRQAVSRQLVTDVELGAYLSGGIDSGSITAIASQSFPNLKTFTCGFDLSSASGIELAFDERAKAEAMSARFKTEHYEMVLKAGDMERSLPFSKDMSGKATQIISQAYNKFVKVVLSGSGGDELFGGYPWRYYDTPMLRVSMSTLTTTICIGKDLSTTLNSDQCCSYGGGTKFGLVIFFAMYSPPIMPCRDPRIT